MPRPSRVPGFTMTYRPEQERRVSFGPPLRESLSTFAFAAFALAVTGLIVYGQYAPTTSRIFQYVVEGDRHRLVPSSVCAIVLCVSAGAAFLREQMRGVILHPDGIETRDLLAFGWPRVRRHRWPQIDRVVFGAPGKAEGHSSIRLDLWDGSHLYLPAVARERELAEHVEKAARARSVPIGEAAVEASELTAPRDSAAA